MPGDKDGRTTGWGPETWFHITDDPEFEPQQGVTPEDVYASTDFPARAGLWVTDNPHHWREKGAYVVELHVPVGRVHDDDAYLHQWFVQEADVPAVSVRQVRQRLV